MSSQIIPKSKKNTTTSTFVIHPIRSHTTVVSNLSARLMPWARSSTHGYLHMEQGLRDPPDIEVPYQGIFKGGWLELLQMFLRQQATHTEHLLSFPLELFHSTAQHQTLLVPACSLYAPRTRFT